MCPCKNREYLCVQLSAVRNNKKTNGNYYQNMSFVSCNINHRTSYDFFKCPSGKNLITIACTSSIIDSFDSENLAWADATTALWKFIEI